MVIYYILIGGIISILVQYYQYTSTWNTFMSGIIAEIDEIIVMLGSKRYIEITLGTAVTVVPPAAIDIDTQKWIRKQLYAANGTITMTVTTEGQARYTAQRCWAQSPNTHYRVFSPPVFRVPLWGPFAGLVVYTTRIWL